MAAPGPVDARALLAGDDRHRGEGDIGLLRGEFGPSAAARLRIKLPTNIGGLTDDVCLYIMRRTQIYLDEGQHDQLRVRARSRGTTASALIREAVAHMLADDRDARRDAYTTVLRALRAGTPPDLPAGEAFVEDLRSADACRLADLADGNERLGEVDPDP
ncbi:hypothetical protein BH23ACT8_BH23ACT8_25830 [soil metagenome]